jgi:hypothetical protein
VTVAVVTSIHGSYDEPKPMVPQDVDVVRIVDVFPDGDRRTAKAAKLRPWRYAGDADAWIWIDGSYEVTSPSFVRDVMAITEGRPLGQFQHPARDCVYTEAAQSAPRAKYAGEPVAAQAAHYSLVGHPPRWGLWECGLIVYRDRLTYLADLWEAEIRGWSIQDQVSQPVALMRAGLRPTTIPGCALRNQWLRHYAHNDGTQ